MIPAVRDGNVTGIRRISMRLDSLVSFPPFGGIAPIIAGLIPPRESHSAGDPHRKGVRVAVVDEDRFEDISIGCPVDVSHEDSRFGELLHNAELTNALC